MAQLRNNDGCTPYKENKIAKITSKFDISKDGESKRPQDERFHTVNTYSNISNWYY